MRTPRSAAAAWISRATSADAVVWYEVDCTPVACPAAAAPAHALNADGDFVGKVMGDSVTIACAAGYIAAGGSVVVECTCVGGGNCVHPGWTQMPECEPDTCDDYATPHMATISGLKTGEVRSIAPLPGYQCSAAVRRSGHHRH